MLWPPHSHKISWLYLKQEYLIMKHTRSVRRLFKCSLAIFLIASVIAPIRASEDASELSFQTSNASVSTWNGWLTYLNQGNLGQAVADLDGSYSKVTIEAEAKKPAQITAAGTNFSITLADSSTNARVGLSVAMGSKSLEIIQTKGMHDKKTLSKTSIPWLGNSQGFKIKLVVDTASGRVEASVAGNTLTAQMHDGPSVIDQLALSSWKQGVSLRNLRISHGDTSTTVPTPKTTETKTNAEASTPAGSFQATPVDRLDAFHRTIIEEELAELDLPAPQMVFGPTESAVMERIKPRIHRTVEESVAESVSVKGEAFSRAWKIGGGLVDKNHHIMLAGFNAEPIQKGDKLLFVYHYRMLETTSEFGTAGGRFWAIPRNWQGRWQGNQIFSTSSGEWIRSRVPFVATRDFAPGELEVQVHLGSDWTKQTMEFGGMTLLNFGSSPALTSLPENPYIPVNYKGREENAVWRQKAFERIEEYRTGNLSVKVQDATGKPIKGAEVTLEMQRNSFHFGIAADVFHLNGDYVDLHRGQAYGETYANRFKELLKERRMFNSVTLENSLKWRSWLGIGGRFDREITMDTLKWLKDNGIWVFGHTMHWGLRFLPEKYGDKSVKDERYREIVLDHIREIGEATAPYVDAWDVVNEHYGYHDSTDYFGREFAAELFRVAEESTAPGTRLFWNESRLTGQPAVVTEEWVEYLLSVDAPIDGIGWQSHYSTDNLLPPEEVLATLNRFQRFGLDIVLTEFDVAPKSLDNPDDVGVQADYIRDTLIVAYSHPAVTGVTYWSSLEPAWKKTAPLFDKDLQMTEAGKAWKQMVADTWFTETTGLTDDGGIFGAKGYTGDYLVRVRHGDQEKVETVKLTTDGLNLTVSL